MRDIAQELIDGIIDSCHLADPYSMMPCGLVCKGWLPRTRYHFFSNVQLNKRNIGYFVDLVDTSSLSILSFVREILLLYEDTPLDRKILARLHCCPNLVDIIIFACIPSEKRYLAWLESDDSFQTHLRAWSANSISLSSLELHFDTIRIPLPTITNFLTCVPSIKRLSIHGTKFKADDDLPPPITVQLQTLHISMVSGCPLFFSWLLSLPTVPRFKRIHFVGDPNGDVEEYFRRAGDGVECLTLAFNCPWRDAIAFQKSIFRYTTKLKNIHIMCKSCDICDVFPLLPASNLSYIGIESEGSVKEVPWRAIADALAKPRFRTVKRFLIDNDDEDSIDGREPNIKLLLQLANARGILE
ncbi:hypothetical protein C8R43DRAFT_1124031 [Mycena crocata]|nr:hypothetical protein C8R43DRAFT_1124031 [Mycena crocata]